MNKQGSMSLAELAVNSLVNLEDAASEALEAPSYKKSYHVFGSPKVSSGLGLFDCITAPCIEQCAVSQDVPGYVGLIAGGEYDQALRLILADNPLPGVTGYICTHPCQTRCTRNDYDEPVAIRALKRSAVEHGSVGISPSRKTKHSVAIIGSGPSGLAVASFLALNGIQVTIFEAKKIAGGMLSIAPAFRLPQAIVQQDINRIISMGVNIELSHPIGGPPSDLLNQGFDSVYIATGFQKDSQLSIAGMDGNGVFTALDFLEQIAQGKKPYLGSRVLVIGGGNTAIDVARTARRITDRSVTVVYRRTKAEMPATQEEIRELLAEGNTLQELASPTKIALRNDRVCGLQCVRNRLGSPDTNGRKAPIPIKRSEYLIEADSVIIAVGQRPDTLFLKDSAISLGKNKTIMVDAETGLTSLNNVYAGGDAVRGPSTIIQACADGRRAARAILSKLGIGPEQYRDTVNHPRNAQPTELLEDEIIHLKSIRARKELQHRPETIPIDRRNSFELVEHPLSERVAHHEAARCLQCSSLCDKCVEVCPNRANYVYLVSPVNLMLPQLSCNNNGLRVAGEEIVDIKQSRQIVHVDDLCNQCGNCATFCVHHGKPYLEKPRLFLQREDFDQESDNAFYIEGHSIFRRERGKEMKLLSKDGLLVFENTNVCINLSPDFVIRDMTLNKAFTGMFSLKELVEMALILRGMTASLPFLFMR
jgi:putative selenate reductase